MGKKQKRAKKNKENGIPERRARPRKSSTSGITTIKVIGVGGGGGNAVTRMMEGERLRGVEFIAANTDAQDLNYALAHRKIYMGRALTRGLGAGMNPDIGKQAAEENRSEIGETLEGADVVFVTAGMGGGTGTGAAPIIAEISREKEILTVAIVTKPFVFEGTQRMNIAQEGLLRLKDKVDALVVIPNDRIFSLIDKDTSVAKAFACVDEILKNAVQGIAELINAPGIINVDFADIKAIMKDAGTSLIGIGTASGQDRAVKAARNAISSPLLETSIDGAKGVLFSIAGGKDLKMIEISEIAKAISGTIDPSAKVIFGAYHDRRMKDKSIKVTVIATGFNGVQFGGFEIPSLFSREPEQADEFLEKLYKDEERKKEHKVREEELTEEPLESKAAPLKSKEEKDAGWDLEIPAFMRRGKKKK